MSPAVAVHGEFLPVHHDLVSAKLREQDLVPDGDAHGHGLPSLGPGAGANSNHDSFIGLGCHPLDENSIEERNNPLGSITVNVVQDQVLHSSKCFSLPLPLGFEEAHHV